MVNKLVAAFCIGACSLSAATILRGELTLTGAEFGSRGWGRSIFVDLRAADDSFHIFGVDPDTTVEQPGSVTAAGALPGPTASLARISAPLDVNGLLNFGRSETVFVIDALPVPVPLFPEPGPNEGDFVEFTLTPARFSVQSRLKVVMLGNPAQVLIDTDVIGRGLVTMSGRSVRGLPDEPIGRYIETSRFVFAEIPEPSTFSLAAIAALLVICKTVHKRR